MSSLWPVAFVQEIAPSVPVPVTLRGRRHVLWKTPDGVAYADDVCPHRRASLSAGRVLEDGKIECNYHGWIFDGTSGRCERIPQLAAGRPKPKSCDISVRSALIADGIAWIADGDAPARFGTASRLLESVGATDIVTDKAFVMPYPYHLQVENVLDIAHLHFVHDRLFGSREKAGPITCASVWQDERQLRAHFVHDSDTPNVTITFLKPGVVIVEIRNRETNACVRKNIVYVSPRTADSCTVLFRDIKTNASLYDKQLFQMMNRVVIDRVFSQDIVAIMSQVDNVCSNEKYVMPAECDALIVMFRKWWRTRQF